VYRYEARNVRNQKVRRDEESKLKPEIIMIKTNRRCRGKKDAVR